MWKIIPRGGSRKESERPSFPRPGVATTNLTYNVPGSAKNTGDAALSAV